LGVSSVAKNPDHFPSRSEALFWVVCELVRAGVDDETIYAVLMNRDWRISDSVTEKGSGAQRYALRQIERAKEDAIDPSLRELNDRHAVIENIGGKCMVIEEVWSPVLKRPVMEVQGFDHFRNRYMNRTVNLGEKKDKKGNVIGDIEMPMGEWWLRSEKRRQYRSIVFMPNGDAAGSYNLWQGFGCEARPGDWSLFREHIRAIVCAGHDEHFAYLLGWMANAVQNPAEPGHTVPVLRGPQGCGKSIFGHHFGRVFGRHYFYATKPEDVLGKFNSHLRETVFLFADEAFFAGDPRNARQLKALVTDPYLTIELKGVNKEQAQNCLHCIMAGNDDWIVQADKDDRRYFVLDALGTHTNDHAYFGRIAQQMKQGGYEAMLHELLTMDLTRFNVRAKPDTAGLQRQKNYSMDPESRWVLHLLRDGLPDSAMHNGTPDVAYPGAPAGTAASVDRLSFGVRARSFARVAQTFGTPNSPRCAKPERQPGRSPMMSVPKEQAVKTLVGTGSYGIPEASRFARVNVRTASRWIAGTGDDRRGRLFKTDLPSVGHRHAVSFLDLVDLLVVGRFRDEGVSFQTVRRVYARLRESLDTPHPFSHRRLLTDGTTIFMQTLDQVGDEHLHEVLTGQKAMPEILKPYLKQIEYADDTQTAARWNIAPGVVLDPARAFGKPIIASEGTTTFVLARAYWANGEDAELVADLFDVSPESVHQAVAFEGEFAPGHAA
jgi:uncharacterized protein (DUF433 family)